jgi:hypothetical protein
LIQVELRRRLLGEPMHILDRKVMVLQIRFMGKVKVQWTYYNPEEVTWEIEDAMQEAYPHLKIFEILM